MLRLEHPTTSAIPIDVEGITPERIRGMSLPEIEKLEISRGNRRVELAEFFRVSGDAADERIEWSGNLSGVHWIGAKMSSGTIRVEGNAGRHLGSGMRGGSIFVSGNTGDWLGAEMRAGTIRVHGNVSDQAGAAYRGSPRGMCGGTLLIDGNAGHEIGHRMRRGLIAVGVGCGDLAGFNMLAGTILLLGSAGKRTGAGMRRGTIGLFASPPPSLLPSFRAACRLKAPVYLNLVLSELSRHEFPFDDELPRSEYDLLNGDLLEGGRGEILVRHA